MDKDEALVICFTNLKGSKQKDLISTAKALQYLKRFPEYSSNKKLGRGVGVSGEIVREFLTLLRLPPNIQVLFEQRKLKSLEQARRLWQLARSRPEIVEGVAEKIADVSAWDARHIIDYMIRNRNVTVEDAKKIILESKTKVEHEYHVIAILPEDKYLLLAKEAKNINKSVALLVTQIVKEWLVSQENG